MYQYTIQALLKISEDLLKSKFCYGYNVFCLELLPIYIWIWEVISKKLQQKQFINVNKSDNIAHHQLHIRIKAGNDEGVPEAYNAFVNIDPWIVAWKVSHTDFKQPLEQNINLAHQACPYLKSGLEILKVDFLDKKEHATRAHL